MKRHRPSSLWAAWRRTAEKRPRKTVMTDAADGSTLSARQLMNRSSDLAARLEDAGGQTVAFRLPNGFDWMALFLALQKIGACALPLDASLPDKGLRGAAAALGASLLWLDGGLIRVGPSAKRSARHCCLKVTSGSTGKPTAIACLDRHLTSDGRQILRAMGIREADRNLAVIPFGHSYGLGNLVMPLLLQGTSVVFASAFTPRQILKWIPRHRITVLPSVPAVFRLLSDCPSEGGLRPLRLAVSAGAVLPVETARAFHGRFHVLIHNFYGSSETGGISYDRTGRSTLEGGSVGTPLPGVHIEIGRDRRLRVHGRAVAMPAGSVRLPDQGMWTADGELRLLGRAGALANIGGKKVHPLEIEGHLRTLPGVTDAWVTVMKDPRGRDYLAAAVESAHDVATLEAGLLRSVPEWKLPRRYVVLNALPRNHRGKLDLERIRPRF